MEGRTAERRGNKASRGRGGRGRAGRAAAAAAGRNTGVFEYRLRKLVKNPEFVAQAPFVLDPSHLDPVSIYPKRINSEP